MRSIAVYVFPILEDPSSFIFNHQSHSIAFFLSLTHTHIEEGGLEKIEVSLFLLLR